MNWLLALTLGAAYASAPIRGVQAPRPALALDGPYSAAQTSYAETRLGAAPPTQASLKAYLAPMQLIRVRVTGGPGNGHQAAGASIIKRLRQLGFEGRIEAVYDNEVRFKLDLVLPGFDPEGPQIQRLPGSVEARPTGFDYKSAERADLALLSGQPAGRSEYGAPVNVGVQPYAWQDPDLNAHGKSRSMDGLSRYLMPFAAQDRLNETSMEGSARLRAKLAGLRALDARLGDLDLLPVYGMSNSPRTLLELLNAVAAARRLGSLRDVVAVPLFSHLEEPIFAGFLRALGKNRIDDQVVVASILDVDGVRRALDARGKIALLRVGGVSQDAFEYLFAKQTLPGTMAGANGQNLMRVLGLPYLNTVPRGDTGQFDVALRMTPSDRGLMLAATQELLGHAIGDSLPTFLLAARDRQSRIARAFAESRPTEVRHDKLAMLLAAAEALAR